MLTRQVSYLNDSVKLGSSCHIILAVEAAASLSHQPLNFIWLCQLTLGFLLLFVAGIGLQLEHRKTKHYIAYLSSLLKQYRWKNIEARTKCGIWAETRETRKSLCGSSPTQYELLHFWRGSCAKFASWKHCLSQQKQSILFPKPITL